MGNKGAKLLPRHEFGVKIHVEYGPKGDRQEGFIAAELLIQFGSSRGVSNVSNRTISREIARNPEGSCPNGITVTDQCLMKLLSCFVDASESGDFELSHSPHCDDFQTWEPENLILRGMVDQKRMNFRVTKVEFVPQ